MFRIPERLPAFLLLGLSLVTFACGKKALGPPSAGGEEGMLHEAVLHDNAARVTDLLAKGSDVNGKDAQGMTPLGIAAERKNPDMAGLLIDQGAQVSAGNGTKGTALHIAIMNGDVNFAELLVSRGADLEAMLPNGFTPLQLAGSWGRVEIAALLLKNGAKVNSRTGGSTPLHTAILNSRSYPIVKLLVDYGADIHARAGWGDTPLHTALVNYPRDAEIVKLLLDRGAEVNVRMKGNLIGLFAGDTPLHQVISPPQAEIAEILLSRGADVNARNARGMTPLAIALDCERKGYRFDYKPLIEILRRNGGRE